MRKKRHVTSASKVANAGSGNTARKVSGEAAGKAARRRPVTVPGKRRDNGRKSILRPKPVATFRTAGPALGGSATELGQRRIRSALVRSVQAGGRRIIAEVQAGIARRYCFVRQPDGSYRLAGARGRQATRLYVAGDR
jgi:hypothetical protein